MEPTRLMVPSRGNPLLRVSKVRGALAWDQKSLGARVTDHQRIVKVIMGCRLR
jgi:hypothetical protein